METHPSSEPPARTAEAGALTDAPPAPAGGPAAGTGDAPRPSPPRFWTAPNVLTLARLALAPVFLAVYQLTGGWSERAAEHWNLAHIGLVVCLAIVILSEITDFLDGQLARKYGEVSDFGKLMDPYADSVYRLTCLFCFASAAHGSWVPVWMVVILLYRDIISSVIRIFALRRGRVVAARPSGKIKALAHGGTIIALLSIAAVRGTVRSDGLQALQSVGFWLMLIAVTVSVYSGIDYLLANRKVFHT